MRVPDQFEGTGQQQQQHVALILPAQTATNLIKAQESIAESQLVIAKAIEHQHSRIALTFFVAFTGSIFAFVAMILAIVSLSRHA